MCIHFILFSPTYCAEMVSLHEESLFKERSHINKFGPIFTLKYQPVVQPVIV